MERYLKKDWHRFSVDYSDHWSALSH